VIFTSDHGESLGEHDLYFEHGWFAYEPSLSVPLMIKPPRQTEKGAVPDLASNLDLLPSLLALLDGPVDAGAPGTGLFEPPGRRPPLVIENSDRYPEKHLGARTLRWKYLRRVSDGSEELYDLREDPGEIRSLEWREPERLAGIRESYEEAMRTLSPPRRRRPSTTPRPRTGSRPWATCSRRRSQTRAHAR
jgi:arylsulfatase A-like enzyme